MRDTPGKQPPCLHERIFAGQRTANGIAVSWPKYHVDRTRSPIDTPGKQPPCLHERIFAGQRTARGCAASCPQYVANRMGERNFPYPILTGNKEMF